MTASTVERQHTLHAMDSTGDTRMTWSPESTPEVEAARAVFNQLQGKGYLAYMVTEKGGKGEVIRDFDPDAEAIIMAPQLVGG